jgi:hypothetical protein
VIALAPGRLPMGEAAPARALPPPLPFTANYSLYSGERSDHRDPTCRHVWGIGPGASQKREEFLVLETLIGFLFGGVLGAAAVMVALVAAAATRKLRKER